MGQSAHSTGESFQSMKGNLPLCKIRGYDARQHNPVERPGASDARDAGGDLGDITEMEKIGSDERAEDAGDDGDRRSLVWHEQQRAHRRDQRGKEAWHGNADSLDRLSQPVADEHINDDRKEQPGDGLPASRREMSRFIDGQPYRNEAAADSDGDAGLPAEAQSRGPSAGHS